MRRIVVTYFLCAEIALVVIGQTVYRGRLPENFSS